MPYSDAELLDDIRDLAAEFGRPPTLAEYDDHGMAAKTTVTRRFGGWNEALEAAGFDPREPTSAIPDEELLAALRELADELGHVPTGDEMNAEGPHWVSTYEDAFGSWGDALEAAGLEAPGVRGRPHDDETLLAELRRVGEAVGDTPTYGDIAREGAHDPRTYVRRFGSWNEALEAAGFDAREQGQQVSEAELIDDLHRLREELGERPTADDVVEAGAHGLATYQRRFGSWSAAVTAAFEELDDDGTDRDGDDPEAG